MTPREFAEMIPKVMAASKDRLPWIKAATFRDEPNKNNCLRYNDNMRAIYGVEADYDGEVLSPAWAEAKLHDADLAGLIYTSPSHTPGAPRWRVICFTSRPLTPAERTRLMARLMGVLGGELDPASFNRSQAFLYGGVEGLPPPITKLVDGRYIDIADDLDAGARGRNGKPYAANDADDGDRDYNDLDLDFDVDRIRDALKHIPNDGREETWRPVGMAIQHASGGSEEGFELWCEWSETHFKFNPEDQRRVWDSFGRPSGRPLTIRSLYRMAMEHGWTGTVEESDTEVTGNLRLFSAEECENLPPLDHIVEDILAPRQVACVFGAPGSGKSALTPYLAWMVAQGEPFFGKNTERGTVFYVSPEDDYGMARRIAGLRRRYGDAPGFYRVSPDGGPWADFFTKGSPHLSQLRDLVEEHRPSLIVIDTLASGFVSLDENDGLEMKRAIKIARSLTKHGAALIIVHHSQKGEGVKTPRGSGVLDGDMDMTVHVVRGGDGLIRGKLKKNRIGGLDAADIAFRIASEPVGTNAKGKPVTAAVLEATSAPSREPSLSPAQMRVLEMVVD